ncbi:S-layer homology domain-containing protein [Fictibacillus phosphorivorans]|uniref:S-layer homology domain-containing protein n=1 Tax=Fictibacillus phosphorivorans TaxID=1221500 RepID=UPI00203EE6E2|nr:S-layer homology domain-containing protein [Fictibacillus phosphorivorans]MCM3717734.1 S-layer homology domain-containing protein [Fictibacillus phosphorivorans]MCM3775634.1 S-layer homology domain-containing protein [Fictibacillus phosphorivorans]
MKYFVKVLALFSVLSAVFFNFNASTASAHNGALDELGGHFRTADCVYLLHKPTSLAKTAKNMDELKALITQYNSNATCVKQLNGGTNFKVDLEGFEFPFGLPFNDIKGHWAQNDILLLHELGLVSGFPDGSYGINKMISRAEAAAIMARNFDLPNVTPTFKDVSKGYWAANQIGAVAEANIMNGYGDNTFKPAKILTRAEIASLLVRAYDLEGTSSENFKDVPKKHWAYQPISTLVEYGLVSGFNDNTFRPENQLTRAEFAAFLARVIRYEAEPELSTIQGVVTDQDGRPLEGVNVVLATPEIFTNDVTSADGTFIFHAAADRYTLTAYKEGYETYADNELILEEGSDVEREIQLAPSDGVGYDFLEENTPYVSSDNGLTVQVTELSKVTKTNFVEYHLSYTETNNTTEAVDQGAFKTFYNDGTSEAQYGNFKKLVPGETKTVDFVFQAPLSKSTIALEYGADLLYNGKPSDGTLKWNFE